MTHSIIMKAMKKSHALTAALISAVNVQWPTCCGVWYSVRTEVCSSKKHKWRQRVTFHHEKFGFINEILNKFNHVTWGYEKCADILLHIKIKWQIIRNSKSTVHPRRILPLFYLKNVRRQFIVFSNVTDSLPWQAKHYFIITANSGQSVVLQDKRCSLFHLSWAENIWINCPWKKKKRYEEKLWFGGTCDLHSALVALFKSLKVATSLL